jgi:hypothetical protein
MRADPPPGAAALAVAGWLRREAEACKSRTKRHLVKNDLKSAARPRLSCSATNS